MPRRLHLSRARSEPIAKVDTGKDNPDVNFDEAAAWHIHLERATPEDRAAFQEWLESNPSHRGAYADVVDSLALLRSSAEDPAMLALRHETLSHISIRQSRQWRIATIAAMLCVPLLSIAFTSWRPWQPIPAASPAHTVKPFGKVYQTAVGERISAALPDGSMAILNTNSRLRVAYTGTQRRLILEAGQALFEVAKGRAAPFVVQAGERSITARGTSFDVRLDQTSLQVALLTGRVVVAPEGGLRSAFVTMTPNQLLVAKGNQVSVRYYPNIDRMTSWRDGMLLFEDDQLGDVVAEFNRYISRPIILADTELTNLRLSGAFRTGESRSFLEALEGQFPQIAVTYTPGASILTLDSAKAAHKIIS